MSVIRNIMNIHCEHYGTFLSNVVFSYFVLLCCVSPLLVLSFPSCLVLSRLASCCLNLVCLALSHLVSSHLVLPCLALPWQGKARHWIWWCALSNYSCKQLCTSCSDLKASPPFMLLHRTNARSILQKSNYWSTHCWSQSEAVHDLSRLVSLKTWQVALPCLVSSCRVLFRPVSPSLVLLCFALPWALHYLAFALLCFALPHLVLSRLFSSFVLSGLVRSCPVLSWLAPPCHILSRPPCLTCLVSFY